MQESTAQPRMQSLQADQWDGYSPPRGVEGIPRMLWHGKEGNYNVLVLELLGPSLEDLFGYCGRKFTMSTVLQLARQMVSTSSDRVVAPASAPAQQALHPPRSQA